MPSEKLNALIECGLSMAKTDSTPPQYQFTLKGHPKVIRVSLKELHSKDMVDMAMFGAWDFHCLVDIKPKEWREIIDEWMQSGTVDIIDTGGADLSSRIIKALESILDQRGEGDELSDLLTGAYVRRVNGGEDCFCFFAEPLVRMLPRWLGHPVKAESVEFALRRVGLRTGRQVKPIRVGKGNPGWQGRPWVVPVKRLEDFVYPDMVQETQGELPDSEVPDD